MKTWLKGGLIGVCAGILVEISLFLLDAHPIFFGFLSYPVYGMLAGEKIGHYPFRIISVITALIYFFIGGTLIGYIYGKIKPKKNKKCQRKNLK